MLFLQKYTNFTKMRSDRYYNAVFDFCVEVDCTTSYWWWPLNLIEHCALVL